MTPTTEHYEPTFIKNVFYEKRLPKYVLIPEGLIVRDQIEISIKGFPACEIVSGADLDDLVNILHRSIKSIINLYKEKYAMSHMYFGYKPHTNEVYASIKYISLDKIPEVLRC